MRTLAVLLLCASVLWARDSSKNHIFIGVSTGFQTLRMVPTPWQNNFLWGIRGGYQFNALKYLAIRANMDYIMALRPTALHTNVYSFLSFNVDMINDFYHISKKMAVGTYVGVGFGYFQNAQTLNSPVNARSFMGYNGIVNVGLGGTLAQKHRVELGVKFPFGKIKSTRYAEITMQTYYWIASYAYLF
ncbi:outer membrane beta-barrel protein [Helicobacter salomonis]|uniref:OMP281 n=1 Tax=Helicobacter salomonis TaxID=56878 RepID=A0A1M4NI74_9HELI|nr:outer membrane beta-barrel protein [Helicobacter salomonis]SFZ72869.1 OMP281 [Helicobacter salomonis]